MIGLRLHECAAALGGEAIGDDVDLTAFSIDTRTLGAGDVYIAIRGEHHDGHAFCVQAEAAGACALLVDTRQQSALPQIVVPDTRVALGELARLWARRHQVPTIAITGSSGKTTVKEITAAILSRLGPVLATEGNLNNDIGVPLTLLRLRQEHRYAVIEMGANHVGEIAALTRLACPDVAVITTIGTAHLEGFGSREAIASAKAEIFQGLPSDGCAVIPADDDFAAVLAGAAEGRRLRTFCLFDKGGSRQADAVTVCAWPGRRQGEYEFSFGGEQHAIRSRLPGRHNIRNALAAIAAVQCLDVQAASILEGLRAVAPVAGRLQYLQGCNGATLIDDSYNANPESVRTAIEVLCAEQGRRVLVLGDLLELGGSAADLHASLGAYAASQGIDALYTVGDLARHAAGRFRGARHFDDQAALIETLRAELDTATTALIKGSRGSRMDRVVKGLRPDDPATAHNTASGDALAGGVS